MNEPYINQKRPTYIKRGTRQRDVAKSVAVREMISDKHRSKETYIYTKRVRYTSKETFMYVSKRRGSRDALRRTYVKRDLYIHQKSPKYKSKEPYINQKRSIDIKKGT